MDGGERFLRDTWVKQRGCLTEKVIVLRLQEPLVVVVHGDKGGERHALEVGSYRLCPADLRYSCRERWKRLEEY